MCYAQWHQKDFSAGLKLVKYYSFTCNNETFFISVDSKLLRFSEYKKQPR